MAACGVRDCRVAIKQTGRRRRRFSAGRWAIERERGRVADPVQPPAAFDPLPVGASVDGVLRNLRLDERDWETELMESWVRLAGATVSRHARPGKVTCRCLTVFVDSPVWLAEMTRTQRIPLLKALQQRFGAERIESLRFMPDPDGPALGRLPTSGA